MSPVPQEADVALRGTGSGDHRRVGSIAAYHSALGLYRDCGDRLLEADTLVHLGDAQHAAEHSDRARRSWRQALSIFVELDHPDATPARNRLAGHRP